jgi:hypothetical protein
VNLKKAKEKTKILSDRTKYVGSKGLFPNWTDSAANSLFFDALESITLHIEELETRIKELEKK